MEELARHLHRHGEQGAKVLDVWEQRLKGRLVLMIAIELEDGSRWSSRLDRRMATDLTEVLGPHPLVEKHYGVLARSRPLH
jgi:hypothetical protein